MDVDQFQIWMYGKENSGWQSVARLEGVQHPAAALRDHVLSFTDNGDPTWVVFNTAKRRREPQIFQYQEQ